MIVTTENEGYGPLPAYVCPEENLQDKKLRIAREKKQQAWRNNQLETAFRKAGIKIEEWMAYD